MMRTIIIIFACMLFSIVIAEESKAAGIKKNWHFKVYLDDSHIGYHHYNLKQSGDAYQLSTKAEFDVKFLYLSVYNYLHKKSETWHEQCLTSLTSSTDDNGNKLFVILRKQNNNQVIETHKGTLAVDDCLRSFAYWDPELLDTKRLINSQTGEIVDINFIPIGNESITINQQKIYAKRYRIKGKDIDINVWYTPEKEWVALRAKTKSGYVLRYELDNQYLKPETAQITFQL